MHTGSMMPPRDGNESDEELLAKVIPLRRREDTAHDPGCSTLRPLGAEAEPREPEKLGPPDRSTLTLEHSIWDPLTLELPRRPTAAQRRLRRVLDARVLHWHGPARRGNRHSSDGRHRCHRARARAQRLRAQRLPPQGGSILHASVIGDSHVKGSKAHLTTARHSATTTDVHRHHDAGAQHRPASSNRASGAAQSTHVSTGDSAGTAVVSNDGSGSSAGSSSPPAVTTATEEPSTTEASTSPSATHTPAASVQPPARRQPSREDAEAKEASSEFGFEH